MLAQTDRTTFLPTPLFYYGDGKEKSDDRPPEFERVANTIVVTVRLEESNAVRPTLERMRSVLAEAHRHVRAYDGLTALKSLDALFSSAKIVQDPADPPSIGGDGPPLQ